MKPTGNSRLPLRRKGLSPRVRPVCRSENSPDRHLGRLSPELNEPTEAQPDEDGRTPPDPTWSTQKFANDKVLYPNLGTYEYPYRLTAKEIALARELDGNHRAMGRRRRGSW